MSQRLTLLGKPDRKDWWKCYLKGAIAFYGVPTAQIRSTVRADQEDEQLTPATLREASVSLRPGWVGSSEI